TRSDGWLVVLFGPPVTARTHVGSGVISDRMEASIWSPLRPEKRTSDGTVTRQFAVTRQMGSSPISWVGLFQEKTEQNQKRIFALVPRRGLEPPRLAALVPETSASTNSATWAVRR